MKKYNFHIVKSIKMAIDHVLAVKNGTPLTKIKTIVSHSQAILQCKDFINSLGVEVKAVENTAVGAKIVSESEDDTIAVLCSKECAKIYGLEVLKEKVQNSDKNYTRFICIAKDLKIYSGSDKISIMTSLSHTPGSLYKLVSRFYAYGLNLTTIESRPIEGSDFEFMFYFDFEGDILDVQVRNLIAELENGSENFKLLGIYKEEL
jgi:chorismate mutase/prephenate dehydratase